MPQKLLKIRARYGVSTAKSAYVVHEIDSARSRVVWYRDQPERTRYMIRFICNSTERAGKTKFFTKRPNDYQVCQRCGNPVDTMRWRAYSSRRGSN